MTRHVAALSFASRNLWAADVAACLQFEAQEKALQMMKRSMMLGTVIAVGSVYIGWELGKRVRLPSCGLLPFVPLTLLLCACEPLPPLSLAVCGREGRQGVLGEDGGEDAQGVPPSPTRPGAPAHPPPLDVRARLSCTPERLCLLTSLRSRSCWRAGLGRHGGLGSGPSDEAAGGRLA